MVDVATLRYCEIDSTIDLTVNGKGVAIAIVRPTTKRGDLFDIISEEMQPIFNRIFRFEQNDFEFLLESTQRDITDCRENFGWLNELKYYEVQEVSVDKLEEPTNKTNIYQLCLEDIRNCYSPKLAYLMGIAFNNSMIVVHKRQSIL